jgi:hypothetical protein
MAMVKVMARRKEDMTPYRTCAAHTELLRTLTEVSTALQFLQSGQEETKKTLREMKDLQQTSMFEIKNALNDAKEYTREEANKIWPAITTVGERLEGAIQERNIKLTEVKVQIERDLILKEDSLKSMIDKVDLKVKRFTWIWAGITLALAALEFLTRVGIIHWGKP